jgi:hypothetical protein
MTLLLLIAYLPELWFVGTGSMFQAVAWGVITTAITTFCLYAEYVDAQKKR